MQKEVAFFIARIKLSPFFKKFVVKLCVAFCVLFCISLLTMEIDQQNCPKNYPDPHTETNLLFPHFIRLESVPLNISAKIHGHFR